MKRLWLRYSSEKDGSPGLGARGGGLTALTLAATAAICTGPGIPCPALAGPYPVVAPKIPVQINPVYPEPGAPKFEFPVTQPSGGDGGGGGGGGGDGGGDGGYTGAGSGVQGATIADNYRGLLGQSVGSGQCVALAQATSDVGLTATWVPGQQVQGNTDIAAGTVIATFDANGDYANLPGQSHTAIYLGQDVNGSQVEDQFARHVAYQHTIAWTTGNPYESGSKFYVVGHS